jgi:outer membrane protein assembly factor BamD (BamD/ComL family)
MPVATTAAALPSSDDELTLLHRAKQQLSADDAAAALATLDSHAHAFPRGRLTDEAAVLRIEALAASGDAISARRAATRFLERHPDSPYAQRVRSATAPR